MSQGDLSKGQVQEFAIILPRTSLSCTLVLVILWPEPRHSADQRLRQSLCHVSHGALTTWEGGEN